MTRSKALWEGYLIGVVMSSAALGLMQDFVGREGYIEYVRRHWIDLPWWPWVLVLLLFAWSLFSRMKTAKREDGGKASA